MRCKTALRTILVALLGLIAGCGEPDAGAADGTQSQGATPAGESLLAGLSGLPAGSANVAGRHVISATNNYLLGNDAWRTSAAGAEIVSTVMELDSTGDVAWALYQWSGVDPADPPVQLVAEVTPGGADKYWMVLSDYSTGTWEVRRPLYGSVASLDYENGADYVSSGNTYAGLIVADGNQLDINRLNLVVEGGGGGTVLFEEPFEDEDYDSRGWYDSPGFGLTTAEHAPGSTRAVEFHFEQGASGPTVRGGRVMFTETASVYVSFHVKYSANWTGSDRPYHPHEFHFVTTENGQWVGPACTHLTTYIEHNEGEPLLAIQDAENIDEGHIGEDLSDITENRSVAGCNGSTDGYLDDCYSTGETHNNGKQWRADGAYFADEPGAYYKNDWHFIEAYFALNSIVEGKGVCDGVVRYWYDGELLIDHDDVLLRTGQHPGMLFNQFMVFPYIGVGSPVAQTMWLDNLTIASGKP
jgi:hypothetical protein